MSYTRIHWEDRLKIEVLVKAGHNQTEIGVLIGKHRTSVSRDCLLYTSPSPRDS